MSPKQHILIVDDDPGDTELIREFLTEDSELLAIETVPDGEAAIAYLRQHAEFALAERPQLIILDLNMPRKDGREVLADIKQDPELCSIPVVVFTTSDAPDDIDRVYKLGGNAFVTKPPSLTQLADALAALKTFWLRNTRLPL